MSTFDPGQRRELAGDSADLLKRFDQSDRQLVVSNRHAPGIGTVLLLTAVVMIAAFFAGLRPGTITALALLVYVSLALVQHLWLSRPRDRGAGDGPSVPGDASQGSHQTFVINGRSYSSIDEMPPDARQQYEQVARELEQELHDTFGTRVRADGEWTRRPGRWLPPWRGTISASHVSDDKSDAGLPAIAIFAVVVAVALVVVLAGLFMWLNVCCAP